MDLLQQDAQKVRQPLKHATGTPSATVAIHVRSSKFRKSRTSDLEPSSVRPSRQSRSAILRESNSVMSPTNPPEFADGSLRILSSNDHNGQRLTLQGFGHRKDLA
jgi:hypothetical protein